MGTSLRHEEVSLDAGGGSVGGEGAGGVAGGGRGELFQAVVTSHGDRHRHAAGFEAAGWIVGLLLNKEVGIATAGEHGSPAFAEGDGFGVREDVGVATHGGGSVGTRFAGMAEGGLVIADVEGSGAGGADGLRGFGGYALVAARAFEMSDGGHIYRLQVNAGCGVEGAGCGRFGIAALKKNIFRSVNFCVSLVLSG